MPSTSRTRTVALAAIAALTAFALATPYVRGQTQTASPPQPAAQRPTFDSFEVATIKPTDPDWNRGRFIRMEGAQQFVVRNHVLRTLIAAAYNLNPHTVTGGPAWVDSEHFDILAATPGDVPPNYDEQMAMLRKLLADRFKLTFHREKKEFAVFAFTIAKGGAKLKESTATVRDFPTGPPPLIFVVSPQSLHLPGRFASMAELASVFQRAVLDRPVLDQTGLSARYDFDLEFAPDANIFNGAFAGQTGDSDKPGLFTALQEQLGLKLEATKGPVDALAIDHVNEPTPN